jgi:pyridoxal phosphate enzyme (YggS family)
VNNLSYVEKNLSEVRQEISSICERCGTREPTLIAVTKSASDEEVLELARLGVRAIGENRSSLFCARYELLQNDYPDMQFNFIGHLQTNKVKYIADKVSAIHSLGRIDLAREIDKQAKKRGIKIPVLIEINSGKEEAKSGVMPEQAIEFFESLAPFDSLSVVGVMTMAPDCENEEDYRPYFRLTKRIFDEIKDKGGFATDTPILSMGMSDSYRVAIEEGSTAVRIGRRLFLKEN